MKKVLFLIHDLGHGGAEKVLVNLANNLDRTRFDISVMSLFGGGINEQFLAPDIHYSTVFPKEFPGNSHIMKLLTPKQLHALFIKEHYDIEVSYLEGPTARVISGCQDPETKLVSWIHCTMHTPAELAIGFRSIKEARDCFDNMDMVVSVSRSVEKAFLDVCSYSGKTAVLYNTNDTDHILFEKEKPIPDGLFHREEFKICGVGKLMPGKCFERLIHIQKYLADEGYPVRTYILGEGPERETLEDEIRQNGLDQQVILLGYQTNPYRFVSRCDLFVCSSLSEGFSTAATEALIVGTPVCTTEVSGMREMLGEHDEWGVITENSEQALYQGIRRLLEKPELLAYYKEKAKERGKSFSKESTVLAVGEMLLNL